MAMTSLPYFRCIALTGWSCKNSRRRMEHRCQFGHIWT